MTAVFATKISAFDPENISQRVLLTKERLYAIDQLNGEGRQQSFAAALLLEYVVKRLFPNAEHPLEIAIAQGGKPKSRTSTSTCRIPANGPSAPSAAVRSASTSSTAMRAGAM